MGNTKTRKHYICPALKKKKNETNKKNKKAKTAKLEKADAQRKELEVKNKQLEVEKRAQSKKIRVLEVKEADLTSAVRKRAMQEEKQEEEREEKPSKKNKQKGGPEEKQKEQKNASTEEKVWDPLALWWEGEEAAGGWQVAFHKGLYSKHVNEFRHLICKLLNCKKEKGMGKGGANWRGMAYGILHFHFNGKGPLMDIEDNCERRRLGPEAQKASI